MNIQLASAALPLLLLLLPFEGLLALRVLSDKRQTDACRL
jgi:hypothetical protein